MSSKKGVRKPEEYTYIGKYAIHAEKFFSRIVENKEGCEIWTGGTHRQGYGMFNIYDTEQNKRRMQVTHRIAMMLELGRELTRDEFVVHEFCDNQLCCNTAHMIVGDATDRNRVQYAKGRRPSKFRGESMKKQENRTYKYTDDELRYMRDHTSEEIAEKFGVTKSAASHMRHRVMGGYKWLD